MKKSREEEGKAIVDLLQIEDKPPLDWVSIRLGGGGKENKVIRSLEFEAWM